MDTLIQHIRNGSGRKIGTFVAQKMDTGEVIIGWSKCNRTDHFDTTKGRTIALKRAIRGAKVDVPNRFAKAMDAFAARSKRYFKTEKVVHAPIAQWEEVVMPRVNLSVESLK